MDAYIMNGYGNVWPMQGTNSVVPMQGTSDVVPMQGTNQVIPLQGTNGNTIMVSPLSLIRAEDIPLPMQGMSQDEANLYRLAYMSGDANALQGKFTDFIKKVATTGLKVAQVAVPIALTAIPGGAVVAPAAAIALGAVNSKIAADQAKNQAAAAGLSPQQQKAAANAASQTVQDLTKIGIVPNPQVVADRSVIAAQTGTLPTKSAAASVQNWWNERSTGEKVAIGVGAAILVYAGYRHFSKKRKGGRK